MSLHLENTTNSCPFALCLGHMLFGTGRNQMMGEAELRLTFLLCQNEDTVCINMCWSLQVSFIWLYISVIITYINEWTVISELCVSCHQDKLGWNHPQSPEMKQCLLSKTKTMSLDILIQVRCLSFKREKIKGRDWLQARFHQFCSSGTRKPVPVVVSDGQHKWAELAPAQYQTHQASSTVLLARSSHGLITAFIWLIFFFVHFIFFQQCF